MRFVIDENVPLLVARALRDLGHECLAVAEGMAQSPDEDVLTLAIARWAVLVTFDGDFGRLIFRDCMNVPAGIVYMRARPQHARLVSERFVDLFRSGALDLEGRYLVIDLADARSLPLGMI